MYFAAFVVCLILQAEALQKSRIVYPRLLEERSSDGRMVVHVQDDLTLNLRKASVAAPQLRVLTEENGRPVTEFYKGEDIDKHLYEDEVKIATVMVQKGRYGVQMRGLVGPKHRIRPMPVMEKSADAVLPHAIHEIEQEEMLDKTLKHGETARQAILSEREAQNSRNYPDVVYIELFVVSDRRHHHYFKDTNHLLWYLCIAVNSANLRYRATSDPKVRLVLTGVEKPQQEPYADVSQNDYLYDDGTITNFRRYAYAKKTAYGHPDLVYLITGYDVYTEINGKASDAGLGIGYVSGVCTSYYVALGEDKPGLFTGVHTLTHEIAHLLGAKHDGDGVDMDTPGHPGAKGCPWKNGHIMSYINNGPEHHQFSRCSLEQMRYVLRLRGQQCWNLTAEGYYVRNWYPGMTVAFRDFCDNLVPDKNKYTFETVTVNSEMCRVLCYYYRTYAYNVFGDGSTYKVSYKYEEDALDFMPCQENMVCIQGRCVKNPVPTTQTTQSTQPPPTVTTEAEKWTTTKTDITSTQCDCDDETADTSTTTVLTQKPTRKFKRFFPWRHRDRK
uniref:Peptidase M12B domain-containing protein n=1 Tax=Amblyomma maculatum TaxID=34609 RepID=G3MPE9_AMBMU